MKLSDGFCRECGSSKLTFYDGMFGYEAVSCLDCGTHHTNNEPILTEHESKYNQLCKKWGVSWNVNTPRVCLGISLLRLAKAYEADNHLNNIALKKWDSLANAFLGFNNTTLSLGEGVCMQKHAAKTLIKKVYGRDHGGE